jgi:capsular polysaccharide biosynthesis protein
MDGQSAIPPQAVREHQATLGRAIAFVAVGDYENCLKELSQCNGSGAETEGCIAMVARGLLAERNGEVARAKEYMESRWQKGIADVDLMLAAARYFLRSGDIERAFVVYHALAQRGSDFRFELDKIDLRQHPTFRSGFIFQSSAKRALIPAMQFKQSLITKLSLQDAFEAFRAIVTFPNCDRLETRPLRSLVKVAAERGLVFHETGPAGESFLARPPKVIGNGNHRVLKCRTRTQFVACLADVRVRGRSALVEFEEQMLLDYEETELEGTEQVFEFDPAVLQGNNRELSIMTSNEASINVDEAFNLLGRHTPEFGHWIWEYVPKYVAATMSGVMPPVSVLVDAGMPKTHRQLLELVLPAGAAVIEVPAFAVVHVQRLWCAPALFYLPIFLRTLDQSWPNYAVASPDRFASVIREMWRRMEPFLPVRSGPERLFLARKEGQHRKLSNDAAIRRMAERRGFTVIFPQDHDFIDQLSLVRNARAIIGLEGSAIYLAFFAQPGTKLCVLSPPHIAGLTAYTSLLEAIGIADITIMTGTVVRPNANYPHRSDFSIPEDVFQTFLDA